MGIPSYFSYIVKNHPHIIRKYFKDVLKVDNLYLDCNSIIYDCYSKMTFDTLSESVAISIIKNVISKIEYYISIIEPSKTVIVAFDGVAPVAKLEQQRQRRYKSNYQNIISKQIFKKVEPDPWNTAAITPGTLFMAELNTMITAHFSKTTLTNDTTKAETTKNTTKTTISPNIIVSGSDKAGEGEHKLFEYIRLHNEKHLTEITVIYGLDADLIMLSINHLPVCPNIYLFRETPHFIQSINSELEPDANYFLDIPELANKIIKYMNNDDTNNDKTTVVNTNKVYDYIFICFFLGNDFLPHFPAINIRTGGVDKMMNAYRATIKPTDNLTDGKTINWANVRKMVTFLTNLEEQHIITEHKLRDHRERTSSKMDKTKNNKDQKDKGLEEEEFKKFELCPTTERDLERYINPFKSHWQTRYYRSLFGIKSDTTGQHLKDIVINYLQGLEWTMKYYTTGCCDWRWRYKYSYPPLLQDLIKHIPVFATEFVPLKPFNPVTEIVQLCYVLPRSSLGLLPKDLGKALITNYDHWYKSDCDFMWAYCRYFWESHVEMNEIDIKELEQFILANRHLFV
jgi:5'-3' exoribonuclease 1